jgi:hypothetical protein
MKYLLFTALFLASIFCSFAVETNTSSTLPEVAQHSSDPGKTEVDYLTDRSKTAHFPEAETSSDADSRHGRYQ